MQPKPRHECGRCTSQQAIVSYEDLAESASARHGRARQLVSLLTSYPRSTVSNVTSACARASTHEHAHNVSTTSHTHYACVRVLVHETRETHPEHPRSRARRARTLVRPTHAPLIAYACCSLHGHSSALCTPCLFGPQFADCAVKTGKGRLTSRRSPLHPP